MQRFADGSWSAPCFMRLRYGSLGFTLGLQQIQSCHVMQVRAGGGSIRLPAVLCTTVLHPVLQQCVFPHGNSGSSASK